MTNSRTLRLRKDPLADLAPDELRRAVGAAPSVFCASAVTYCDAVCKATTMLESDPCNELPPLISHRCA